MATFADMFNQAGGKLETAFNNPWMQLGLQLMQAGGPQQTNMSTGQRLAQAGMGFMDQRAQAAQMQAAQQKAVLEQQRAQAEIQTRDALRKRAEEDPDFLKDSPLARAVLAAGGTIDDAKKAADMGPKGPGVPKMPYQFPQKNPDGTETQLIYDPQAPGGYRQGATYTPTPVQQVQLGRERLEAQGDQFGTRADQGQQRIDQAQQRIAAQAQQAEARAAKAAREAEALQIKSSMKREDLAKNYNGAVSQLDRVTTMIKNLKAHKGLDGVFGVRGAIRDIPGTAAADARTKIQELKDNIGLSELVRLDAAGVKLTPVSNSDIQVVQSAGGNLDRLQSKQQALETLENMQRTLEKAKAEAQDRYKSYDSIYDTPSSQTGPSVGTVEDGYEFIGGDPADPQSWRKR